MKKKNNLKIFDRTITLLFNLLFIFFSFGQIERLSFNNQEINFYLYELLLIIIFVFLVIKAIKIRFKIQILRIKRQDDKQKEYYLSDNRQKSNTESKSFHTDISSGVQTLLNKILDFVEMAKKVKIKMKMGKKTTKKRNIFGLKDKFETTKAFVLITIFWLLLTYFLNFKNFTAHQNLVAGLYLIRLLFYFFFFVFLFLLFKNNLEIKISIRKSFNIFIILTLIIGLIQYFLYPNLRNILYLGWDPHWYRLLGGFFDSYLAGAVFGLLSIYFFLKSLSLLSLIFFIFLILTFSRNAYLAFSIFLGIYFLKLKKLKSLFIFILLFLLVIFVSPKPFGESVNLRRVFTIEARINDYQKGWQIWKKNWFFGIGYNRIRYLKEISNSVQSFGYSHAGANFTSSYLTILVTTGIFGLVLFLSGVKKILMINQLAFFGGIFLLTMSFFDNVILHPIVIFIYFMMVFLF